jgi:hypothetical protein
MKASMDSLLWGTSRARSMFIQWALAAHELEDPKVHMPLNLKAAGAFSSRDVLGFKVPL